MTRIRRALAFLLFSGVVGQAPKARADDWGSAQLDLHFPDYSPAVIALGVTLSVGPGVALAVVDTQRRLRGRPSFGLGLTEVIVAPAYVLSGIAMLAQEDRDDVELTLGAIWLGEGVLLSTLGAFTLVDSQQLKVDVAPTPGRILLAGRF